MLLGELISRFEDELVVVDALSCLDDARLIEAAEQAAHADGVSLGTWAREAVGRFAVSARDEQWLGLLTACSSSRDPGTAALRYMLGASCIGAPVVARRSQDLNDRHRDR